ncbi:MAG: dUTP diphosphatase [Eubacteriales bacterium]
MNLKVKALSPLIGEEIPLPYYATQGSAGMDLHACNPLPLTIKAGERATIPTGIAIALPSNEVVALIYARSGMAIKHGLAPSNCVGVIDSDYRGEILVSLHNNSNADHTIFKGERIAQLVITPILQVTIEEVEFLEPTQRGEGRFGSTGV